MALASWFGMTRKFGVNPDNSSRIGTSLTRKLDPVQNASMRIFGQFKNPLPGQTSGRAAVRRALKGPALTRWWTPHLRTRPGLWYYKSEKERYQLAKNSFLRTKGRIAPKKGAGKKALKRMADAKKAAARAAKK